ncbi:pyridoxal phosphate-dependent aminotransferase [Lysinibacillus fusiformis]|uniref:pyridoxal phosphate-dependent aminotransferase n=1 Tax=Lysinibacillus fusiformis TaxID=28031 RepID=UPI0004D593C8|nr:MULTISPECIES: pyridoxal phosphate-dependent aminotransferase [Lysinibacillus]KAB0441334.1 pyridoxal phosphate-dependent aminotransferase [Lysinibacillus fusiformis]KEK11886.1 aminotransferase [Lysinibacillus sphaericus]MCT6814864.1 pyridoxal phosphate-dependent aminotransferase [Lysinibacillus fusiformis]MCT6929732.1 pyridoxal phosphate-dependent aminotransferase [Lysinibacillus fusiformis]MCT6934250.1 pyridoxal phosphate-dependent aminotransferase [Lysinibacillus fusiformis]
MEFSKKLQQLPTQFFAALVQKVNNALEEGRDVINLGQGNPDQPTPTHIIQALQEAAENPQNHKYSPFRGIAELRQAAADFYKREYDVEIDPDTEVAILGGTKIGLVELPLAVLNPGDTMLLPDPGYPDYLSGVVLGDVNFEVMPLFAENNFLPDYEALPKEVKEKAKLLYLNYPNNPTGGTATLEFFEETIRFAKEHNIIVSHDFAYGAIGFDGNKPISFLQANGAKEVGIEMYTLSKTYNMAGWRIGFAVGNADLIAAINLIQDHLFCSQFPAIQHAAAIALTSSQECADELRATYERRRNVLIEEAHRIGWQVTAPRGSFFAWLPVPLGFTSEQFADILLDKADIAVAAGNGFGQYGEGYVRIGLLVSEERLREAMHRIEQLKLF